VWPWGYTDSDIEVNWGIKRIEPKGTVFKWLCRTSGIRTVVSRCLTMYGILTYTALLKEMKCHMSRAKTGKWKMSYVGFRMLGMEPENEK
jgi:hypothetical protein